ncbi:bifunctional 5,10-methylene-tetrahydrofolate dehydrogenase/5,10-methylene-tetrahydrofolate cyclohydrolase [Flavipsychrobacter stenotrophus]|uniref:Bifunctional protein FolD n=1 Tax=Flavipsychrobacter stenotrophus TaxID=2077091 RepID=A0A2S7SV64_9BACT|nr:bifunctional 5,10-methylenetetrahydrofolate dehydrogenase/5,10-methenyltetrahydrofolate cyclohydrolase [Flavipsychrobacter stenotrophus]PQJ10608.1 bifunctional 5,10-methylene-tetrahydrofolate dehydrogenase/5,10-methylene-tetrahydrofolate cyclohydrolase [Flavipsychrobacter stenotrophus]
MQILDGTLVSAHIKEQIKQDVIDWQATGGKKPHLAAILVGNNPASEAYVGHKVKSCAELGFESTLLRFDPSITETELIAEVKKLNDNADVDGILVQLPLPNHISGDNIINTIDPAKDVDGFHPISQGKMMLGQPTFLPATPYGIMLMLEHYNIDVAGMHCVVIGRSNIVGTPMTILLSRNTKPGNATVTLTHSRTKNLAEITRTADVIVAAIGKPFFVTADMVRPGAIVIDVGINRIDDATKKSGSRLVGDVDYDNVAPLCSYITPVPKGVGPMTICGLMMNTLLAAKQKASVAVS